MVVKPLFTYPIADTSWLVVIARDASHFYYDTASGKSVWQVSDTCIDNFKDKVNFDDLGVLFAKANGFAVEESHAKRPKLGHIAQGSSTVGIPPDDAVQAEEELSHYRNEPPDAENLQEPTKDNLSQLEKEGDKGAVQSRSPARSGLNLGYTSEEEEEEEAYEKSDVEESNSSMGEAGVNEGLDLGFESESEPTGDRDNEDAKSDFERLLDEHKSHISLYDPWFMVEEDLLPKFAREPAFYALNGSDIREKVFNEWVARQLAASPQKEALSSAQYPTSKLRLFQFLQEFKPEVKKLFYPEFYRRHTSGLDRLLEEDRQLDPETIYRELRVILNDHAETERAEKRKGATGNLKMARVEKFLREKLKNHTFEAKSLPLSDTTLSAFDQWAQLCNSLSLPNNVVENATNFILGDEKRLDAYVKILGQILH